MGCGSRFFGINESVVGSIRGRRGVCGVKIVYSEKLIFCGGFWKMF